MEKVPVFCGKDCGGNACPLLAMVEGGVVTRIINNPAAGQLMTGCRRGYNLPLEVYAKDRILKPLIRTGERGSGDFREASWGEALDLVAGRLGEIKTRFGSTSILNLASAGSTAVFHNTEALLSRFLNLFGGATVLNSNYSNAAASFILPFLLGKEWKESGFDASTMIDSRMIILWGANPMEARLGTEVDLSLLAARNRGAKIVVVDPRRSPTARRLSAWWIPCRPGTDTALMLALLHTLFRENLVDRASIERYSHGFGHLEAYVLGKKDGEEKSPAWASKLCGTPVEEIIRFSRMYGTEKPALLFPGYSIQRVFAGEEPFRLTLALQIATGNFGKPGGSTGSLNNRLTRPRIGTLPALDSEDQITLPVVSWPDLILQGKGGGWPEDIHAAYIMGCNFLNQGADLNKNIAALGKLDFSVIHELFLTPTARYCDIVLPVAHTLEREDLGIPWAGNFLTYKPQAVKPPGDVKTDYEILSSLASRLGFEREYTEGRNASQWIQLFMDQSEIPDQEEFRKTGVYIKKERAPAGFCSFIKDPEEFPLSTPSGKAEIYSETYFRETGFSPYPVWQSPPEDPRYPLRLITPKPFNRTHSQGGGVPEIESQRRQVLEMNPEDALERGISEGEVVLVHNPRGECLITVSLERDILKGTVSLAEGVWVEFDQAGRDLRGSANLLTSTTATKPGFAVIMHGIPVQVSKNLPSDSL